MYGKVFDSIYDGTLYGHWEAIVTMQQLIVLATPDGVVDMMPQAIAARTSIPIDIITKGLKVLSEPDAYTRTPGEDGRRIVLLEDRRPWGWRLVNHQKYRGLRNAEEKRRADRERISEKRKKNRNVAIESHCVANVAHSDSYSDSDTDSKTTPLAPSTEVLDAVISIPILGNREFKVSKALRDELDNSYPAVDPDQTLREIRAWCLTNADKRKTARGMPRFINRWFAKQQDHHGRS